LEDPGPGRGSARICTELAEEMFTRDPRLDDRERAEFLAQAGKRSEF